MTGNITDVGQDLDSNGGLDYLVVSVEVSVSVAGDYMVWAGYLEDDLHQPLFVSASGRNYLWEGAGWLNISFSGPAIYGGQLNISRVPEIILYEMGDYYQIFLDMITDITLSRTYNYTEFDCAATLTGVVHTEEADIDYDSLLDFLIFEVEVEVFEEGMYEVALQGLRGDYGYASVYDSSGREFLMVGLQTLNVSAYGPTIFGQLHDSKGNVSYGSFTLSLYEGDQMSLIYEEWASLGRSYIYYEFESHAYFTGNMFDDGIDEDGDSLFDYLEVGIETNVTEAGEYEISVGGLMEKVNETWYESLYYGYSVAGFFDVGLYQILFNFSGLMLAYEHFSPTNLSGVNIYELDTYTELSYLSSAALSAKYDYTQFNSPFQNMSFLFTVYPDATVQLKGSINNTRMYPIDDEPHINMSLGISPSGNDTSAMVVGTMIPPESQRSQWPLNSTIGQLVADYHDGLLDAKFNATLFMPPDVADECPLNSTCGDLLLTVEYSNEWLTLDILGTAQICPMLWSEFPFNISDLTLLADYESGEIRGNITFHTVAGFPLADVIVDFQGDYSEIRMSGHVNVLYGNYSGTVINATTLEEMLAQFNSTIPGTGDGSLYNMTAGAIECTSLNTSKTSIGPPEGARIEYNATVSGDITDLLARIVTGMGGVGGDEAYNAVRAAVNSTLSSIDEGSLQLNYYNASKIVDISLRIQCDVGSLWAKALQLVPPTVPLESQVQVESAIRTLNASAYAVENASLAIEYSGAQQRLDLTGEMAVRVQQLKHDSAPFIPSIAPPELKGALESYFNITYGKLSSLSSVFNYAYGALEFEISFTFEGDFMGETNHAKKLALSLVKETGDVAEAGGLLAIQFLNLTEVDVENFNMALQQGSDWRTITFEGLKMNPPEDTIDAIRFRLENWLNMTADPQADSGEFEKLKVVVASGFNGTHVILLHGNGTVPPPDTTSFDYKTMMWEDVRISDLRDLLFKIAYQGSVDYLGQLYYVPVFTNSSVSSFSFSSVEKELSFNVTGGEGTGFCNVTIPRALLYAASDEWVVRIDGTTLGPEDFEVTENEEYVFLYINYTHSGHLVEIQGTWVISEYPPSMFPIIIVAITLAVVALTVMHRRKLRPLKTRYHEALQMLISRTQRLLTPEPNSP